MHVHVLSCSLVKRLCGSETYDVKGLDSKWMRRDEFLTIFFWMNPIYEREKSIFLFSFYVRKHPNAYRFICILANETKGKFFQPNSHNDLGNSQPSTNCCNDILKHSKWNVFCFFCFFKLHENWNKQIFFGLRLQLTMFWNECKRWNKKTKHANLKHKKIF